MNMFDKCARYQPGGSSGFDPTSGKDPLSDGGICLRDAILMQKLGINTIRVYNLDPSIDHTTCASIFNAAGIYLALDVNSPLPNQSINRAAPWESYNVDYITRVFQMIEAFKNFNNTLGFFSANEVINEDSVVQVPQYIRAVQRDMKDYIAKHSTRPIPVGYSAADVRPLLTDTYDYLSCSLSNATSSSIDFFGLNSYSWCGDATYTSSGYDVLVSDFSATKVPVFFSEYGCNAVQPRTWSEISALYSNPMMGVFSGGIAYEWTQEENDFGLVQANSNNTVSLLTDYNNLQTMLNKIDLKALTAANSTATSQTAPACTSISITSNITKNFDIPARPDGFQSLIDNGVSGTYPTGFSSVSNTAEPDGVYASNGGAITGLSLTILAGDESNLPGNNTIGTNQSGTKTSSGGKPSNTNAAVRAVDVSFGLVAAAVAGLLTQL